MTFQKTSAEKARGFAIPSCIARFGFEFTKSCDLKLGRKCLYFVHGLKALALTLFFIGTTGSVFAFEVNTHQALTRCAISDECESENSLNLKRFVEDDAKLASENYDTIVMPDYGANYQGVAIGGIGLIEWNIGFGQATSYRKMIEAGVILEDALWPLGQDGPALWGPGADITFGDGRYMNHFYNFQGTPKRLTAEHGLVYGTSHTDALTWAIKGPVLLAVGEEDLPRVNRYSLKKAFLYFRKSFTSENPEARKKAQAKLFVSLGHFIHLVQDMHSPAHTRNDSHPFGDPLEKYGREGDGAYRLEDGYFDSDSDDDIVAAIKGQEAIKENSYRAYITESAKFSSTEYFSNDTVTQYDWPFWLQGPATDDGLASYLVDMFDSSRLLALLGDYGYAVAAAGNYSVLKQNALRLMPRAVGPQQAFWITFFAAGLTQDCPMISIR